MSKKNSKYTGVSYLDPANLKNHPANIELYGDAADPDFVESCREGIHTPILVSQGNVILSGHRRMQAARILGMKEIPCLVADLMDEDQAEEVLIRSNTQREKTTEQKAREFKRLKAIAGRRADGRKKSGKKSGDLPENFTEGESGDARDVAAESIGMSGKTAEKASEVVQEIDRLEAEGKTEEASDLRKSLEKSVDGAHRKATKKEQAEPKEVDELKELRSPFAALIRYLGGAKKEFEALKETKVGAHVDDTAISNFNGAIKDAIGTVKYIQPHSICSRCDGKPGGCKFCRETRYMTERLAASSPKKKGES